MQRFIIASCATETALLAASSLVPAATAVLQPCKGPRPQPDARHGRSKLWRIPESLLCSVVGTCFGTSELRKLVVRCSGGQFSHDSDLAVHEEGVRLAGRAEPGGKVLHKALDQRYCATIKRFERANSASELAELWDQAKRSGEIPGAYWAVLTHRSTTVNLRQEAFGDVHMLSHLVGAANRADIRRLTRLEAENLELRHKTDRQQKQLHDAIVARDEVNKGLREQLAEQISRDRVAQAHPVQRGDDDLATLRQLVARLRNGLALGAARCERVAATEAGLRVALAKSERALLVAQAKERELREQLEVMEDALVRMRGDPGQRVDRLQDAVAGRSIVYIGGRPGAVHAIRDVIERANGKFTHHDGGIEDRRGLLASAVNAADLVIFPVDCISHDAMDGLKRLCRLANKPYRPVRSASVSSLLAALIDAPHFPPGIAVTGQSSVGANAAESMSCHCPSHVV